MKSVFQKGMMYKLSCSPSSILYVAENKTLAGKEDRTYEGEAMGRKLAIVFFEVAPGGLVRRVHRETLALQQQLLSLAELLQTIGGVALPPDPARTAADAELLLEAHYQTLDIWRYKCTLQTGGDEVHTYTLDEEVDAEAAHALALSADHRTKMVLARALQRHEGLLANETLQEAWNLTLPTLQGRAAPLFPAAHPGPADGGGRRGGRGRGGRGRARGRGRPG